MRISEKALKKIAKVPIIKAELVRITGKSYATVCRWIERNDPQLTRRDCLHMIMRETGLTDEELFPGQ